MTKKSLFLSFSKSNNRFKKLDIDIRSINYPKSSLGSINKSNKEYYTLDYFKQEAQPDLVNKKNQEFEMQQIKEEHKQLEINRNILTNKFINQNSHTINPREFKNNTLFYVHAPKQINTRYGLNYTKTASFSDELNEQTKL